jgi:hypothetical protein
MFAQLLERISHFLAGVGWVMGTIWIGLAIFTVALLILMYTRWGQSHPLEKCLGLSVLAHALLAGYATTVSLAESPVPPGEPAFQVTVVEGDRETNEKNAASEPAGETNGENPAKSEQPWEVFRRDAAVSPEPAKLERIETESPLPERVARAEPDKLPGGPPLDQTAMPAAAAPEPKITTADEPLPPGTPVERVAPPLEAPQAQSREAADPVRIASLRPSSGSSRSTAGEFALEPTKSAVSDMPSELLRPSMSLPRVGAAPIPDPMESLSGAASGQSGPSLHTIKKPSNDAAEIPKMYKLRVAPDRSGVAERHGGSPETEKAVEAALKWLAGNQAADGRWKAGDHGAGRDEKVLGHARQNAGSEADTGVTGLALLAFLAGGNTHQHGEYKDYVRRGLEYLMRIQARDGNLGGSAAVYEFMYCHAMATCALSEAFGMTGDDRLRRPVERAIGYTVAAQDPKGGGWRYHPGDPGDTSQLGWQLMALKSADLAGVVMPETTRNGIMKFLQSVSSGNKGGLASYRAGEQVSHSMTAEALVCWQFLGLSRDHPACNEAGDFLLTELPGQGVKPNDYYWYYGTLAMYQLQGDYWKRWNAALQKTLLERQIKEGPLAGAWDTDTVWGGYGGRIYTTAIATLSMEVYYRFLPLYSK